jgi:hypothetical protein
MAMTGDGHAYEAWKLIDGIPAQLGVSDLFALDRGVYPDSAPTADDLQATLRVCEESAKLIDASMDFGSQLRAEFVGRLGWIRDDISFHVEGLPLLLGLSGGRIVFYQASVLGDYVQRDDSGILVPHRALVTYHNEQFGSFTSEQISEFEDILNNPRVKELDLHRFFEQHTHFFLMWQHREVYTQVLLTRENDAHLVPDVILTDAALQRATVVELKLPRPKLIRRQRSRDRFAAAVKEARSQLLEYRDYFRDEKNRQRARELLNMDVYEPRLAVIIGRSSEFADAFDRQRLQATVPDVEIVTYDDLLIHAKRRKVPILTKV